MGGGCKYEQKRSNRSVYDLCNKAAAGISKHGKCTETRNTVLFPGCGINTYLQSFGSGYSVNSRVGITTEIVLCMPHFQREYYKGGRRKKEKK